MAELLCDMDYLKAEYERAAALGPSSPPSFRITMGGAGSECTFEVGVNDGARFVAELDVLAALIRARILKAQLGRE